MAVQSVCYEVRMQWLEAGEKVEADIPDYPRVDDLERFYEHLEATLTNTGFINPKHPGQVMTKLRRLYNRARPEESEINILRGMLASVDKSIDNT